MTLSEAVAKRHTAKAFDNTQTLSEPQIETLLHVLQNTPSSVNSQPWHFVVASTEAGKKAVSASTSEAFAYNAPKVLNASHVIAFCMRADMGDDHLQHILEREALAGRFRDASAKAGQDKSRRHFIDLHRYVLRDLPQWMEKQVYIALGGVLLSAALMGIDATPMEGFDTAALDTALGLREKGLTSVVLVALGYHSDQDFNAALPKSRLPREAIFTFL